MDNDSIAIDHQHTATVGGGGGNVTADIGPSQQPQPQHEHDTIDPRRVNETDASVSAATTTTSLRKSALQDNLDQKGQHAYYFAHAHRANGPAWDGKIEPKLLSRSSSNNNNNDLSVTDQLDAATISSSSSSQKTSFDYRRSNITTYAFHDDGGAKIKLYLHLKRVGEQCTEDDVTLDYTNRTLSFTLRNYQNYECVLNNNNNNNNRKNQNVTVDPSQGNDNDPVDNNDMAVEPQILRFGRLWGDISNATVRIRADTIILTLTKTDPTLGEWPTIHDPGITAAATATDASTDHHEVV